MKDRDWKNEKCDWKQAYFSTKDHPHRKLIIELLKEFKFDSLLEAGCNCGPNLTRINEVMPEKQLYGIDINKQAIETGKYLIPNVNFKCAPVERMPFAGKSIDIILTDATLIYVKPENIEKVLKDMKWIAKKGIVLCEFYTEDLMDSLIFKSFTDYYLHDYKKILIKLGFLNIKTLKLPAEYWPDSDLWAKYGYIITANI
jgi:ubiquinone/menaquinone biosynthesis C-methylase UbiE